MVSQKKLLVLKFEDFYFEPAINSLITPLLDKLDLPDCHSCNIFDNDEDSQKTHSSKNLDKTFEFFKNIYQVPHNEIATMKIIIKKILI